MTAQDWQRLKALRERYLTDASAEYWTERDLALYDATFARRIGWKWEAVLADLSQAGWKPRSSQMLDWGCGTGIASRATGTWSGIQSVEVFDQSRFAMAYAIKALEGDGVRAKMWRKIETIEPGTLLVLSHVVGELKDIELTSLARLAATAEELIWVEPGSREISRRLGSVREILQTAGHAFIGPCTHQKTCPMLTPENEGHWCHFFARPPSEVFQSAFWRKVSDEIEIDLRALPYSFLASSRIQPQLWPEGSERLIGRPRELKAQARLLCCGEEGLMDRTFQKRVDPNLFRRIIKKDQDGVFSWKKDASGQITGGHSLSSANS